MTTVISRHSMLRAIVTEDGHRAINPDPYVVLVVDCRNHADPEQALERWRARYSTRTAPASQWPLVTVAAAIAPDGVHLSIFGEGHDGRGGPRALRVSDNGSVATFQSGNDRVCGAEVNVYCASYMKNSS